MESSTQNDLHEDERIQTASDGIDMDAIISSSEKLKAISVTKRSELHFLLSSGPYQQARNVFEPEDIHQIISAVLSKVTKSSLTTGDILARFTRLLDYYEKYSPDKERSLQYSMHGSLLEDDYFLPLKRGIVLDSEDIDEFMQLISLVEDLLAILELAKFLRDNKSSKKSPHDRSALRTLKEKECKDALNLHPYVKEAGFNSLLLKWGVQLKIFPSGFFKSRVALSKLEDLDRHIRHFKIFLKMLLNSQQKSSDDQEGS